MFYVLYTVISPSSPTKCFCFCFVLFQITMESKDELIDFDWRTGLKLLDLNPLIAPIKDTLVLLILIKSRTAPLLPESQLHNFTD